MNFSGSFMEGLWIKTDNMRSLALLISPTNGNLCSCLRSLKWRGRFSGFPNCTLTRSISFTVSRSMSFLITTADKINHSELPRPKENPSSPDSSTYITKVGCRFISIYQKGNLFHRLALNQTWRKFNLIIPGYEPSPANSSRGVLAWWNRQVPGRPCNQKVLPKISSGPFKRGRNFPRIRCPTFQ